ncbi:MAG: hypothetical protein JST80_02965 [Bdellovibrionales bacterium]|nr:hypothetical protein [Bdellovibrionales bacterium]
MDFSAGSLFAGFVFGVFGFYIFNLGRKRTNAVPIVCGLALMLFPYFVENVWVTWIIGSILMVIGIKAL